MKKGYTRGRIVKQGGLLLGIIGLTVLLSAPARSAGILLGTDYFETVQPTFFTPLDPFNPLQGLPIGPGMTDTIVQRKADCNLDLSTVGSNCNIPIEMVALSLQSTVNPLVQLRESPTIASTGTVTMSSDGTGTGGTFDSFFDVFFELSFDDGLTFTPGGDLTLTSSGARWTTVAPPSPPAVIVPGLIGDQNANLHTNKNCPTGSSTNTCDFYVLGTVQEQHLGVGLHTARTAQVPEPSALILIGFGLIALASIGRRRLFKRM